ncbi:MAG: PorP/SprF family type IX secretion system membrane protein [Bacteroidota bacterium]
MKILYTLFALLFASTAYAQLKPVNAIYYFNEYLMNPAMAGKEQAFKGSLGYRKQMTSFGNAPQTQFLTAEYGYDERSGFGLKVYNEKAGLLKETSIGLSYAYHLALTEDNKLSFGLTGIYSKQGLSNDEFSGDLDDPDLIALAQRKGVFDSDFGMAFSSENFTAQIVLPNLVTTLKNDINEGVNYATFFTAISYKIETELGVLAPKLAFRDVKGMSGILDFGANFKLNPLGSTTFNVMALYHTSKNTTLGASVSFNDQFSFNTSYTLGGGKIGNYSNGDFEMGLAIKL